jgi:hypothetical protein
VMYQFHGVAENLASCHKVQSLLCVVGCYPCFENLDMEDFLFLLLIAAIFDDAIGMIWCCN